MRKIILILIFIVTQTFIIGQNYNTAIGIKLSPGIATYYIKDIDINLSRFSTNAGIEVTQRIYKDKLFIETGLCIFDRGFKENKHIIDDYGVDWGLRKRKEFYYYLNLPISLKFKYKGFFVGTGPNINYNIANRTSCKLDGEQMVSTDNSDESVPFLFGGQFFLGYELKLSNKFIISSDGYFNSTFKGPLINYGLDIGLKYILSNKK